MEQPQELLDHCNLFQSILINKTVTTLFQPIINLHNGHVIGYEALSRGPERSPFFSPIDLINYAEAHEKLWELECILRKNALKEASSFINHRLLFLNIDPRIIYDPRFKAGFTKDYLLRHQLSPQNIVFEITERTAIKDYHSFKKTIDCYTKQGFKIAIDDVGAGYSGIKTITETRPSFLKLDRDLIQGIEKDGFKQSMVKAFVRLAQTSNLTIIGEGIETKEQLKILIRLGVHCGQGYYLGYPKKEPSSIPLPLIEEIQEFNKFFQNIQNHGSDYHYIFNLVRKDRSFSLTEKCLAIHEYFLSNTTSGICITSNDYPAGLIMRHALHQAMAKRYGFDVYSNRPIELLIDKDPLIVDCYTPINMVAQKALERDDTTLYDDIIVTKASKYYGMVTMRDLLEYAITYEKNYARQLNPLTSLPGNEMINRTLETIVNERKKACICYLDIDNFKIYNDIYGFENGDKIIMMTAEILKDLLKDSLFPFFIGHIGGDDFIFVLDDEEASEDLCKEILHRFHENILTYFNQEDIERGYIESDDRYGIKRQFQLTTLSIGGLSGDFSCFQSLDELSYALAGVKKEAKKLPINHFVIKRLP